jgi:hypothetical protein
MKRQGGGFGVVMLLVVVAIVLLLVARSWKSVAPTAVQVSTPAGKVAVPDHGDRDAAAAATSGNLPDLNDARRETGAHAEQLQDAMKQVE